MSSKTRPLQRRQVRGDHGVQVDDRLVVVELAPHIGRVQMLHPLPARPGRWRSGRPPPGSAGRSRSPGTLRACGQCRMFRSSFLPFGVLLVGLCGGLQSTFGAEHEMRRVRHPWMVTLPVGPAVVELQALPAPEAVPRLTTLGATPRIADKGFVGVPVAARPDRPVHPVNPPSVLEVGQHAQVRRVDASPVLAHVVDRHPFRYLLAGMGGPCGPVRVG